MIGFVAPSRLSHSKGIAALFPALLGFGGVQTAGRLTAAALGQISAKHGWPTTFLSLNDPPRHHTYSLNDTLVSFSGFGRAKARFLLSSIASAPRTRIVIAAHPYLAMATAPMKFLNPRLKTIVISHGVEIWQRLPAARRKAFLTSDLFLAPSRYSIEQLIAVQGVPRSKTVCLPWPLDPEFLDLAVRADKLPVPLNFPKGLVVLTAARLSTQEKYKGVDQLIRIIAQIAPKFSSLHLAVIGSGDDLPRHEQLSRDLGITERVHFFPGLSQSEIAACYSRCDLFVLPSTGEGFGFVFLEAMAFAKPVIGVAAGGVTDLIDHERNGLLVQPGDDAQLTQSLERLLMDDSFRHGIGRRGAEAVAARFRFDRFCSQLETILNEV